MTIDGEIDWATHFTVAIYLTFCFLLPPSYFYSLSFFFQNKKQKKVRTINLLGRAFNKKEKKYFQQNPCGPH